MGLLAQPRREREPVTPQRIKRARRDPADEMYKHLARRFAQLFGGRSDEEVRRFLEQRIPPVGTEARWIRIESLEDFLLFDEVRRRRLKGTRLLDGQFTIEPGEGRHVSEWIDCPNFIIRRHETGVEEVAP